MKSTKIFICFIVLLSISNGLYGQSIINTLVSEKWEGYGKLMGTEASSKMNWQWTLGKQFVKLKFQNKRNDKNGDEIIFEATAYYNLINDATIAGYWFDNRGISFPLKGNFSQDQLTIFWGDNTTEQGKTIYKIINDDQILVQDYISNNGKYTSFGEATYRKILDENVQEVVQNGFDEKLAENFRADDYGMKKYVVAFLKKGPNRSYDKVKANEIQQAHLRNIQKMASDGKLVIAGPFLDDSDIRGIYIFNVDSIEEAKELTKTDPAIQAGSLIMELKPWYGSAALQGVNELHKTLTKKK